MNFTLLVQLCVLEIPHNVHLRVIKLNAIKINKFTRVRR